ncbi:MAG: hypothetical protein ACOYNI_00105 [Acidimicrobiia bacterium]
MTSLDVAFIQGSVAYPSVSLLVPVDDQPASIVRQRLRALGRDAAGRLAREFGDDRCAHLVADLEKLIESVEVQPGQRGIAVYVNERLQQIEPLPVRVRERVVVDETFATRDLVRARQCSPRYRVVTLSERVTRCYEGLGFGLSEVRGGGFPLIPDPDAADSERSFDRDERLGRYVRRLDAIFRAHHRDDPLPIVLVGAEPRVSQVMARSELRMAVSGVVRATKDFPDPTVLAALVGPVVEQLLAEEVIEARAELESAAGTRIAFGIEEVWLLASHGRGDLLLVEESFEYPAYVDSVTGHPIRAIDRDAPGVVDDLVDELIEVVLAKRGRCTVVPDGSLAGHGRVALKLRY